MRPLFKVIIAVFIILIAIAVASQVRGDELPKLYHPDKPKETWTHMVNHLMTAQKEVNKYGDTLYRQGFASNDKTSVTLIYNHTNGALSMTIVELSDRKIKLRGIGDKVTVTKTREIQVMTMISFDFDTIPDLVVYQEINLDQAGDKQIGTKALFDSVPHGKTSPRAHPLKFKKQLEYMATWGFWEVHIMDTLGFKFVKPVPKEET